MKIAARSLAAVLLGTLLLVAPATTQASLVADFVAANYDPTTGIWTDSVAGPSATAVGAAKPNLITSGTGVTPNGSATLQFSGGQFFTLSSSIPVSDYSVFVFLQSTSNNQVGAITGGASGALEYRINPGTQDALKSFVADYGHSTTTLPTSSFSSIGVQVPNATGTNNISFFLNGIADGTASNTSTLSQPILNLGATSASNPVSEFLQGYVAEIRIYNDTSTSATLVNAAFQNAYVSTVPEPSSLMLVGLAAASLFVAARRRGSGT